MKLACIKCHPAEGPGAISDWARERGISLEVFEPGGGALPELSAYEGFILMGGPMSVHDASSNPDIAAILELVGKAVEQSFPFLGICLGAQMLAKAAGGEVVPGPRKEIGWFSIEKSEEGLSLLEGWPKTPTVFHWHGEQIVAPRNSQIMALNELCPVQAFQMGKHQLGIQFHLETNETTLEGMLNAFAAEVAEGGASVDTVSEMREGLRSHGEECRRLLFDLLDRWASRFSEPSQR